MTLHVVESDTRDQRQTWYFTFGIGQPNAGRFVVVKNVTSSEARARMLATFGREWAFQYNEADWHKDGVSQADKYDLVEIDTREQVWLSAGIERPWRITSDTRTYGEFDTEILARMFLALLLEGNPDTLRART